jgi:hypothetical protein
MLKASLLLFFFFFDVSTQEGGREIRTSDIYFIKCGPNRLSYFLGTPLYYC